MLVRLQCWLKWFGQCIAFVLRGVHTRDMSKPYTVREMKSGRTSAVKFNVYAPSGERVNVHAYPSRRAAQLAADDLTISNMVADFEDDPRPYAERLAEAKAAYRAEMGAR